MKKLCLWLLLATIPSIGFSDTDRQYNTQLDYALSVLKEASLSIEEGYSSAVFNSTVAAELLKDDPFISDLVWVQTDADNRLILKMKADAPVTATLRSAQITIIPNGLSFFLGNWVLELPNPGDLPPSKNIRRAWQTIPEAMYILSEFCTEVDKCKNATDEQKANFSHKCEHPYDGQRTTYGWVEVQPRNAQFANIQDIIWCPAWLDVVVGPIQ
jgi:hypothetical protein